MKITKHDKLTAIGIQIERLENFLNGVTINRYSDGTINQLRRDLEKLYAREEKLINPPAPKQRKPKSPAQQEVEGLTRSRTVSGEPIATFTPSGSKS